MIIFPAIDLRKGKCVRLVEGDPNRETIYGEDPLEMAKMWQEKGAEFLHLVDLDGAFSGLQENFKIIKEMVKLLDIPVEVGGGIRDMEKISSLLEAGVNRVILGTVAIKNPALVKEALQKFGSESIVLGIDAKDGKVAVEGWGEVSSKDAVDLALEMKDLGIKRIIFTDISRDGTLKGPNLKAIENMTSLSQMKIIASGGVSVLDDIKALKMLEDKGVEGIIMGKALYAGSVKLEDALLISRA